MCFLHYPLCFLCCSSCEGVVYWWWLSLPQGFVLAGPLWNKQLLMKQNVRGGQFCVAEPIAAVCVRAGEIDRCVWRWNWNRLHLPAISHLLLISLDLSPLKSLWMWMPVEGFLCIIWSRKYWVCWMRPVMLHPIHEQKACFPDVNQNYCFLIKTKVAYEVQMKKIIRVS